MEKPQLLVIAGCNGAGKSSYSGILSPEGIAVFDYDKHFLEIYSSIIPTDFQDQMAHNMTFQKLETQIDQAIDAGRSFAYETNFNSDPLYWPLIFKAKGYVVNMIYFCLNSVEEAQKRVAIRVENGGHFVPDSEIMNRFNAGYSNLDEFFVFFDTLHLFNSSTYGKAPDYCLTFRKGELVKKSDLPIFLEDFTPKLYKQAFIKM
ncbi:zeta toxin family protein [Algoriphagus sp. NG3]|uniref:zeta toxin family protein n=1 Tax=Algoriphagus sp. NG3 TaxID=3097546 RepID=UPI002A82B5B3|nr:zeta toxin family protein [Algoriphagus sp. NG3]WPR76013.1 zeta toxin family protein [Algoriphagus sp. NG3]